MLVPAGYVTTVYDPVFVLNRASALVSGGADARRRRCRPTLRVRLDRRAGDYGISTLARRRSVAGFDLTLTRLDGVLQDQWRRRTAPCC
ncbi:MAG: hypothetical protein WDO24_14670 [Pseudomonadota bacterium]